MSQFRPLSETKFINDANLVSYWKLDGNSLDETANNNDGTDTNITYGTDYGKFGQGALFNGSSSAITFGDVGAVEGIGTITIATWIYATADNTRGMLVSKDSLGQRSFFIDKSTTSADNKIHFSLGDGSTGECSTNTEIPLNEWVLVVATYDKNNATASLRPKVYFNGVSQALTISTAFSGDIPTSTSALQIGAREYVGSRQYFAGNIDDVSIFSRALSASEVNELYQGMTLGEFLPSPSTKLLLHLNGSSVDSSGNNNNGTDTAISYVDGKFGKCALFTPASSSKIQVPTTGFPTGASARTLSFWVYKTSTANSVIFGYGENALNGRTYGTYIDNTSVYFWAFNDDTDTGIDVTLNKWENLIFTYDGTNVKVYYNGNLVSTIAKTLNTIATQCFIGAYAYAGGYGSALAGNIDELLLDARAWSASEVKKYYTYAKGRFGII